MSRVDSDRRRPNAIGVQVQSVSPAELYEVIIKASSQDFAQVQAASQRLKQLLDMFGAYDALQEIAARRELQLAVRQQAIIQFKNAVTSHWRSRKLLSDEHRVRIRQRCLTFTDEDDDTIAECNEVVVAKLARTDYPSLWPNLLDDLVHTIDSHWQARYTSGKQDSRDTLRLRRSLKLLNAILKEFASIKLPNGMKIMGQIVERLRLLLYNYYARMSVTFAAGSITQDNISLESTYDNIVLSHLVYKCLIKIGVWLWNKLEKLTPGEYATNFAWLQDLFQNSLSQLKSLVMLRKSIILALGSIGNESTRRNIIILSKHLRVFGKFFRRWQQLSAERFALLPTSAELVLFYWSEIVDSTNYPPKNIADSDEVLFPVRLVVQGLILFKDSLSQWAPVRRSGIPNKNALSKEFVENAVQLLVSRFMLLNASDLENWLSDPEDWAHSEDKESDQWEYEIRACSERVMTQLCNYFSPFVVPLIGETFKQIAPSLPVDMEGIIQKEALYCAVGRCARCLKDVIDFEAALETTFIVEVRETNPEYTIIKRRLAWLIGKWISEECGTPNDPKLWDVLSFLLSHEADTVVRLTAAAALRECVGSLAFEPNSLAPFLISTVPQLIRLMGEVDTLESKRKVDECLNIIIERSGALILPFVALITSPIPQLWATADKDLLFKGSLLVTVTKVVEAVKEHSSSLSPLIIPLVKDSLAPENIMYLDADGLNLWLAALRNSVTIVPDDGSPGLRVLFPQALQLLATNLDLLGSVTGIVESYFLLDAFYVLQSQPVNLFRAFLSTFRNKIVDMNAKQLLQSLGILVQLTPSNLWGEAMHTSGLFPELLKTLIAEESSTLLLTEHIYLFSRMILSDSRMFLQLMTASTPVLGQTETTLYNMLMGVWWEKFDNMSEPRYRKLTALATAVLVSTGRPEILEKLSTDIFNMWLDVFGELKEADERRAEEAGSELSGNSLICFWELNEPPDSFYQGSEGTPEYSRRKALYEGDPVRTTPLIPFVGAKLREAETICGPTFQMYMQDADATVLKQIQSFLASN